MFIYRVYIKESTASYIAVWGETPEDPEIQPYVKTILNSFPNEEWNCPPHLFGYYPDDPTYLVVHECVSPGHLLFDLVLQGDFTRTHYDLVNKTKEYEIYYRVDEINPKLILPEGITHKYISETYTEELEPTGKYTICIQGDTLKELYDYADTLPRNQKEPFVKPVGTEYDMHDLDTLALVFDVETMILQDVYLIAYPERQRVRIGKKTERHNHLTYLDELTNKKDVPCTKIRYDERGHVLGVNPEEIIKVKQRAKVPVKGQKNKFEYKNVGVLISDKDFTNRRSKGKERK